VVWTAGVASNSQGSFPGLWGDVGILCKDEQGEIVPWGSDVGQVPYTSSLDAAFLEKDQPFARISASFNTNHFILSRPYPSIPFLTSSLSPSAAPQSTLAHLLSLELSHRISQLDSLGLIPSRVRRLLGGERVPAEIVIVPRLGWKDLMILARFLLGIQASQSSTRWTVAQGSEGYFDSVTRDSGWEEWIFRGERGVWEVGGYIRAKCAVEITLDHCMT
jgi:TAG lipase/lysophosphatidylethanolamine acyltransferase